MYAGNGKTKEFPLPDGADGSVVLLTAAGCAPVRLNDDEYRVERGAAVLRVAPPAGVAVSFGFDDDASGAVTDGACTVVYADGSVRVCAEDPLLIVSECRAMVEDISKIRRGIMAVKGEIEALAAEAREDLNVRLLSFGVRVEEAVSVSASAARDEIGLRIKDEIAELRSIADEIRGARKDAVNSARAAAESADRAAAECRSEVRDEIERAMTDIRDAWARIKEMKHEAELEAESARSAAVTAGRSVIEEVRPKFDAVFDDLRRLRGALERDVMAESARRNRDREDIIHRMENIRDDTMRSVERMDTSARAARMMYDRVSEAERETRRHAERADNFNAAWNARIRHELEERSKVVRGNAGGSDSR